MKKTPAINTIFEKVKHREYEKNALLKQDIISYYYQVLKEEKGNDLFRFRDLSMWLMKNNLEFFNYYKGSHVKYRDRVENRKYRIENALRDLMTLGLIRIGGTGKARKINTDIDIYEYTKGGQLCAWLIKSLDDKQRQNANNEIYDLLLNVFKARKDSSSITISRYLERCEDKRIFDKLVEYLRYLIHLENAYEFKSMTDLLVYVFDSGFRESQEQMNFLTVWYEVIHVLQPEIQNMMLYRMKLSIERSFESMHDLTKEYEEFRFRLRGKYQKIALEGYCRKCDLRRNVALHYLNYVKRFILVAKNEIRVKCPICKTKDSIIIPYLF